MRSKTRDDTEREKVNAALRERERLRREQADALREAERRRQETARQAREARRRKRLDAERARAWAAAEQARKNAGR